MQGYQKTIYFFSCYPSLLNPRQDILLKSITHRDATWMGGGRYFHHTDMEGIIVKVQWFCPLSSLWTNLNFRIRSSFGKMSGLFSKQSTPTKNIREISQLLPDSKGLIRINLSLKRSKILFKLNNFKITFRFSFFGRNFSAI